MMKNNKTMMVTIGYALLAALLYGLSSPLSKLLLNELSPILLSSLLYFGAGFGMLLIWLISQSHQKTRTNAPIQAKDTPYVLAMIALDIVAPFLLMMGLLRVNASTVSLLNNFEIVFTALIAMIFFKEIIGKKMWMAIILILIAGGLLAVDDWSAINLSTGALYVVGAGLCWGLENNCTRKLSYGNPLLIVILKGLGSGFGSFIIALGMKQFSTSWIPMMWGLILGFFAYGLSIYFYISAQRHLGAARTSAYYALAPFIGSLLSFIALQETISLSYIIAFMVMGIGTYFSVKENQTIEKLNS